MADKAIRATVRPIAPVQETFKKLYSEGGKVRQAVASAAFNIATARAKKYELELQVEPGKPNYPIQWTSKAQRIAVIAYLKSKGNYPYTRTHKTSQAWRAIVLKTRKKGELLAIGFANSHRAENAEGNQVAPYQYVYGRSKEPEYQQGYHYNTGWYNLNQMLYGAGGIQERMSDDILEGIGKAGKRAMGE